ncbi:MAG: type III polyketide synthase [Candidatus Obscuribacterales bacterium]|nr:type III polyketide synthase [Candidatus Obscuribacterales bacterium]
MKGAGILGIGTALPGKPFTRELALAHARELTCKSPRQEKILAEVYRRTSVETRSSVLAKDYEHKKPFFTNAQSGGPSTKLRMERYASEAPGLALIAATQALDSSGVDRVNITHLITVSCTGFVAPGFDIALIQDLPLRPTVSRAHLGFMGCHGIISAIKFGSDIVASDANAVVLVCAAELCSLHFQYEWSSNNLLANALFSDGAGAVVLGRAPAHWRALPGASTIVPDSIAAIRWNVGDHGFEMTLDSAVPDIIERELPAFLTEYLARHSLSIDEIGSWAVHPGGPRILDAVESCLKLPELTLQASRDVLAKHGNMSSPTVLFVFEELMRTNAPMPCVFLGFGPGLAIEALLVL